MGKSYQYMTVFYLVCLGCHHREDPSTLLYTLLYTVYVHGMLPRSQYYVLLGVVLRSADARQGKQPGRGVDCGGRGMVSFTNGGFRAKVALVFTMCVSFLFSSSLFVHRRNAHDVLLASEATACCHRCHHRVLTFWPLRTSRMTSSSYSRGGCPGDFVVATSYCNAHHYSM